LRSGATHGKKRKAAASEFVIQSEDSSEDASSDRDYEACVTNEAGGHTSDEGPSFEDLLGDALAERGKPQRSLPVHNDRHTQHKIHKRKEEEKRKKHRQRERKCVREASPEVHELSGVDELDELDVDPAMIQTGKRRRFVKLWDTQYGTGAELDSEGGEEDDESAYLRGRRVSGSKPVGGGTVQRTSVPKAVLKGRLSKKATRGRGREERKETHSSEDDFNEEFGKDGERRVGEGELYQSAEQTRRLEWADEVDVADSDEDGWADWNSDDDRPVAVPVANARRSRRSAAGSRLKDVLRAELVDVDEEWEEDAARVASGGVGSQVEARPKIRKIVVRKAQARAVTEQTLGGALIGGGEGQAATGKRKIKLKVGRDPAQSGPMHREGSATPPTIPQTDGAGDCCADCRDLYTVRECSRATDFCQSARDSLLGHGQTAALRHLEQTLWPRIPHFHCAKERKRRNSRPRQSGAGSVLPYWDGGVDAPVSSDDMEDLRGSPRAQEECDGLMRPFKPPAEGSSDGRTLSTSERRALPLVLACLKAIVSNPAQHGMHRNPIATSVPRRLVSDLEVRMLCLLLKDWLLDWLLPAGFDSAPCICRLRWIGAGSSRLDLFEGYRRALLVGWERFWYACTLNYG
jgi:hypothetical protein